MDPDEGRALLSELLDRATTADKVYSHTWSVGDTVIWDNRGVLHRAVRYDPTPSGDELIAWSRDRMAGFKVPRFVEFLDQYR